MCEIFSKIEVFLGNKNFMISKKNQQNFTEGKKDQNVNCRLMIHEIKMLFQKGPIVTLPKICAKMHPKDKSRPSPI